jgi:hypothetical protein
MLMIDRKLRNELLNVWKSGNQDKPQGGQQCGQRTKQEGTVQEHLAVSDEMDLQIPAGRGYFFLVVKTFTEVWLLLSADSI